MKLLRLEDRVLFEAAGAAEAVAAQEVAEQLAREAYGIDADGNFGGGDAGDANYGDANGDGGGAIVDYTQMSPRDLFTVATDLLMNNPNATAADHPALAEYERIMSSPMPAGFAESFNEMLQDGSEFSEQMKKILGEDGLDIREGAVPSAPFGESDLSADDLPDDYNWEVVDDDDELDERVIPNAQFSEESNGKISHEEIVRNDTTSDSSTESDLSTDYTDDADTDDDFDDDDLNVGAIQELPANGADGTAPSLVIINSSVLDADKIIAALGDNPNVEILRLESGSDALQQILDYLNSRNSATGVGGISHEEIVRNDTIFGDGEASPSHGGNGALQYGSLQIVSHGNAGYFVLNGQVIDAAFLADAGNAEMLRAISAYFTNDADMLLYGCNLAGDAAGQNLVNQLSAITGMDVAASIDTTGAGGNWTLEYVVGTIETANIVVEGYEYELAGKVFTVDNTVGKTFADAIADYQSINTASYGDYVINFALAAGNETITVSEIALSNATAGLTLTIDGSNNQVGGSGVQITLSGNNANRIFNITKGDITLKNLTVTGGRVTVTAANDGGGGIYISGASTNVTLDNVTVSGNAVTSSLGTTANLNAGGGGIYVLTGGLTVKNSRVENNSVSITGVTAVTVLTSGGGGIYVNNNGNLTINTSYINGNTLNIAGASNANQVGGGGIAIFGATGTRTITDSFIYNNTSTIQASGTGGAGGVYVNAGTLTVNSSEIYSNTSTTNLAAALGGGAIYGNSATLNIKNCSLYGNTASSGGAICVYNSIINLEESAIFNNTATFSGNAGGGIYIRQSTAVNISNSTIYGNVATGAASVGGGIGTGSATTTINITNSTITGNVVGTGGGGGINVSNVNVSAYILNSIIYGNYQGTTANDITQSAGTVKLGYSVYGVTTGTIAQIAGTNTQLAVNETNLKSVFAYVSQDAGSRWVAQLAYSVKGDGAGVATNSVNGTATIALSKDFWTGNITVGARTVQSAYAAINANVLWYSATGATWARVDGVAGATAQTAISVDQRGINQTLDVGNTSVAGVGSYWLSTTQTAYKTIGALNTVVNTAAEDPYYGFSLRDALYVIGKYGDNSAYTITFSGADFAVNKNTTITLTAEINFADVSWIYQTTAISLVNKTVMIDGGVNNITLQAGNNARVFNIGVVGNFAMSNLTLNGAGTVLGNGGAIIVNNNDAIVGLDAVTISNCKATNGGAIYLNMGNLTVENSTIAGNTAIGSVAAHNTGGGGIYVNGGMLTINQSTIDNNQVTGLGHATNALYIGGGGIYVKDGTVKITNSTISNNKTPNVAASTYGGGGGIYLAGGNLTVENSTINGNSANATSYVGGGGIYALRGTANIINSTIYGNTALLGGGVCTMGKVVEDSATINIVNCTITGNIATSSGGGTFSLGVAGNTGSYNVLNSIIVGNYGGAIATTITANDIAFFGTAVDHPPMKMAYSIYGVLANNTGGRLTLGDGNYQLYSVAAGATQDNLRMVFASVLTDPTATATRYRADLETNGTVKLNVDNSNGKENLGANMLGVRTAVENNIAYYSANGTKWFNMSGVETTLTVAANKITTSQNGVNLGGNAGETQLASKGSWWAPVILGTNITSANNPYSGATLQVAMQAIEYGWITVGATLDITFVGLAANSTINLTNEFNFTTLGLAGKTVTIDGSGTTNLTIQAANNSRVFNISGAGIVTIKNLTLLGTGTVTGNGGAILTTTATVNLDKVKISNFTATNGGGIFITNGIVNITNNSEISNNTATVTVNTGGTSSGGGIYVTTGIIIIDKSVIKNNTANVGNDGGTGGSGATSTARGGGIYIAAGDVTIRNNSLIENNTATVRVNHNGASGAWLYAYGGGISITGGELKISGSIIQENTANVTNTGSGSTGTRTINSYGGGLYATGATSLTITGTKITDNNAIVTDSGTSTGTRNQIAAGGGIYANNAITISGSNIDDNIVKITNSGGASGNRTLNIFGGGIYANANVTINNNSTINGNEISGTSVDGGATVITNNGGGIYIANNTINITDATISKNIAENGAGIYLNAGTLKVENSTLSANIASGDGGAIYIKSGTANLTAITLNDNSAVNGGGIAQIDGVMNLVNSTIYGNTATENGGGIYAINPNTNVNFKTNLANVTITNNTAGTEGGGIYADTLGGQRFNAANIIVIGNFIGSNTGDIGGDAVRLAYSIYGTGTIANAIGGTNTQVYSTALAENSGALQGHLGNVFFGVSLSGGKYRAALADYGGKTYTVILSSGSLAQRSGAYVSIDSSNVLKASADRSAGSWKSLSNGSPATDPLEADIIKADQRGVSYTTGNGKLSIGSYFRASYDLTVTAGITVTAKDYNNNTTATAGQFALTSTVSAITVSGAQSSGGQDVIVFGGAISGGMYNSKDVLTATTITLNGLTDASSTFHDGRGFGDYEVKISGTINALTLTVDGITADNKVYDGNTSATLNTGAANLIGVLGVDVVSFTGVATGAFADKNAANGITVNVTGYTLTGTHAGNYKLSATNITQTAITANITPKAITVSGVVANNKTYDGTTDVVTNTGGISFVGVVGGDTVSVNVTAAEFGNEHAGVGKTVNVTVELTGAHAGNYTLSNPNLTTTATISKVILDVTQITVDNKTYNNSIGATLDYSAVLAGKIIGGDNVTISATGTFDTKDFGTGKTVTISGLTLSGTASGNYTLSSFADFTKTANIAKAEITVTADAKTKVYGETAVALTYVVTGNLYGHSLTGELARTAGTNAGTYAINQNTLLVNDGNSGGNFTIHYTSANYVITQRAITVSAHDQTIITGGAANATNYHLEHGTLASGDNLSVTLGFSGYVNSNGIYNITVDAITITNGLANYNITYELGKLYVQSLDVLSVTVTITSNGTREYGVADAFTYSLTFYDTKNSTNVAVTYTGGVKREIGNDVGEYGFLLDNLVVTTSQFTADKYILEINDVASNEFTITKAKLTVTVTAEQTKVYGNDEPAGYAYTVTGLKYGQQKADVFTGSLGRDAGENAGSYNILLNDLSVNDNYEILTFDNTNKFVIAKRVLTIDTISVNDKIYDGNRNATIDEYALGNLLAGDTNNVVLSASSILFADKDFGFAKTVTISGFSLTLSGGAIGNYELATTSAKTALADIERKMLTIDNIVIAGKVYDGNGYADITSATVTGKIIGDNIGNLSGGAMFEDKNVGTHNVSVMRMYLTGTDGGNYYFDTNLFITTGTITQATLTVTATAGQNKVYGDPTQALTYNFQVAGFTANTLCSDDDSFTGALSRAAGNDAGIYAITQNNLSAGGNYALTFVSKDFTINKRVLTITGIEVADKVYDGTTVANVSDYGTLNNVIAADLGKITLTIGNITFADKNVGAGKEVTLTGFGLNGDADVLKNYVLSNAKVTVNDADITAKTLTISGITAADKVYNGNTNATIIVNGIVYNGLIVGDKLSATVTGQFADAQVGNGKNVALTYLLNGDDAKNYNFVFASSQQFTTASITVAPNPTPAPNPYVPPYIPPVFNNDSKNDNNISASDIYLATASSPYYRPMTGSYDYLYEIPHLAANAIALPTFSARVEMPSHRNPMQGIYSANRGIQPMLTLLERILPMNSSVTNGERTVPSVMNGTHRLDVNINEFSDDIKIEGGEEIHWDRLRNINPLPHLSDPDEYVMIDESPELITAESPKSARVKSTIGESIYDLSNDEIAALEPEQIDPELYAALGAIKPNRELYNQIYGIANVFKTDFDRQFDKMMAGIL